MPANKYHVAYVTGAPASGKSTLCGELEAKFPDTKHFSYSKELLAHVAKRAKVVSESEIRQESAKLITRDDVTKVDRKLKAFVDRNRNKRHVLIDSHPVTKEEYGFRITPFTKRSLRELAPTLILLRRVSTSSGVSLIQTKR